MCLWQGRGVSESRYMLACMVGVLGAQISVCVCVDLHVLCVTICSKCVCVCM